MVDCSVDKLWHVESHKQMDRGEMMDNAKYFLLQQDPNDHSKHAVIHLGNFGELYFTLKKHDILQA